MLVLLYSAHAFWKLKVPRTAEMEASRISHPPKVPDENVKTSMLMTE